MSRKSKYVVIKVRDHRVLVDPEVAARIAALGLVVDVDARIDERTKKHVGYAFLVQSVAPYLLIGMLHDFVWSYSGGREKKAGEIIHHRDENKLNNRFENLGIGTRAQHEWVHRHKKQRFRRRRRFQANGFYQPRAPGRVVSRPDIVQARNEAKVVVPTTPPCTASRTSAGDTTDIIRTVAQLRRRLAEEIDAVRREVRRSLPEVRATKGMKIAPWREPETFLLGLRRPDRLTVGDAVFVARLIQHSMDRDQLATYLGVERGLVEKMLLKPAVHQAVVDWQKDKTLPYHLLRRR